MLYLLEELELLWPQQSEQRKVVEAGDRKAGGGPSIGALLSIVRILYSILTTVVSHW